MNVLHIDNDSHSIGLVKKVLDESSDRKNNSLVQCGDWFDVKNHLKVDKNYDLIFINLNLPIFDGFTIYQMLVKIYQIPKENIYFLQGSCNNIYSIDVNRPILGNPLNIKVLRKLIKRKEVKASENKTLCLN